MKLSPLRTMTTLICAAVATVTLTTTTAGAAPTSPSLSASASGKHDLRHQPKIVTDWAAAWNGTEPEALGALFTADADYTDQALGVTLRGRAEISGWKARTNSLIDNARATVRAAHRDGDHITIEAVYSGHIKGAAKPFAVPMAVLLDLDGPRRIASDQDYYSLGAVLAQSGLPADWTPPAS
ncbi:nuclear transport factor 2 family protein [Streptomyces sp. NPDC096310]|uniref:nuclear transport factor 2 family protein n=1 Tax=Streptomyces sp. NPDC096310 TaxID=3366082 RepID=UPI0038170929